MPNWCSFKMIIKGKKKKSLSNVKKHIMGLKEDLEYENERVLYRTWIYKRYYEKIEKKDDCYILKASGECAWSCYSCMFDTSSRYLEY